MEASRHGHDAASKDVTFVRSIAVLAARAAWSAARVSASRQHEIAETAWRACVDGRRARRAGARLRGRRRRDCRLLSMPLRCAPALGPRDHGHRAPRSRFRGCSMTFIEDFRRAARRLRSRPGTLGALGRHARARHRRHDRDVHGARCADAPSGAVPRSGPADVGRHRERPQVSADGVAGRGAARVARRAARSRRSAARCRRRSTSTAATELVTKAARWSRRGCSNASACGRFSDERSRPAKGVPARTIGSSCRRSIWSTLFHRDAGDHRAAHPRVGRLDRGGRRAAGGLPFSALTRRWPGGRSTSARRRRAARERPHGNRPAEAGPSRGGRAGLADARLHETGWRRRGADHAMFRPLAAGMVDQVFAARGDGAVDRRRPGVPRALRQRDEPDADALLVARPRVRRLFRAGRVARAAAARSVGRDCDRRDGRGRRRARRSPRGW